MDEQIKAITLRMAEMGATEEQILEAIEVYKSKQAEEPQDGAPQTLSKEDELLRAKEATHQDWWSNNADLGNVGDYTQNEAGNWVNSAGEVVLYRENPWASGSLNPLDVNNIVSPGDGTSYVWRGLASRDRSKELAEQLEKQQRERDGVSIAIEAGNEVEEDSLATKSRDTNRKAQKFFGKHEDIVKDNWEYIGEGKIREISTGIEYEASNLPNEDQRYLELIDILKSESEIATTEDQQARESGSINVSEITKKI